MRGNYPAYFCVVVNICQMRHNSDSEKDIVMERRKLTHIILVLGNRSKSAFSRMTL
jgi:hypothetical protein